MTKKRPARRRPARLHPLSAVLMTFLLSTLMHAGHAGPMPPLLKEGLAAEERGDYPAASLAYAALAFQDDPMGMFLFGQLLQYGRGVARDYSGAILMYRNAGFRGLVFAQKNLCYLYVHNREIPRDAESARRWCQLAAYQGNDA